MIQYIYFVKCPNCEDEHFDFFDDAKGFAMGCLSKKPIITQTEVCRNDFGECTDSSDLGTVWSWEDECKDCHEPVEEPTFTKDEIVADYKPDTDPEFVDDDSDFRFVNDMTESINGADLDEIKKLCDEIGIITMYDLHSFMKETGATDDTLVAKLRAYRDELGPDFKIKESANSELKTWTCFYEGRDIGTVQAATEDEAVEQMMIEHPGLIYNNTDWFVEPEDAEDFVEESCSRKPVPEGMTIEQLVETMEENEDEVECTWCNELFPKDYCRKEVDLGYLCPSCEAAIKSRGEPLTFRENNYWDFLDEDDLDEDAIDDDNPFNAF